MGDRPRVEGPELSQVEAVELPDAFDEAPPASERLDDALPAELAGRIDSHFEGRGTKRIHTQLDRPLYRPGEDIWVKTYSVATRGLARSHHRQITCELLNPRGEVVVTKAVQQVNGTATTDFALDADAPGGQWTLRSTLPTGEVDERPFVVSSYTPPRIRKTLEFVREAYGPGEQIDALLELEHPTRGPLADIQVRALLQVAGETVLEDVFTTDDSGAVLVSADLPSELTSSDGLLTLLVDEGGITESISRSVPIVLADLQIAFFPEGGDLIAGLPGRVYFEGTNRHGEPADIRGTISDDHGEQVAEFSSVHDGLGRAAFTPKPGRLYVAHVTSPPGVTDGFPLPASKKNGCALRSFDDVDSEHAAVRVAVRCTDTQQVLVAGVLRESVVDTATVEAGPHDDAVLYLDAPANKQGAVRVTVFDPDLNPLAERLVYRNAGRDLAIEVTADREQYGPRDEVVLSVRTTDPSGAPVAAELAMAVVDDAVISLADDKEGHMLSRLYLEPELVDSPNDPGWYFDEDEVLAPRGLDLVMGTKGWRRFDWVAVWSPPQEEVWELEQEAMNALMGGAVELAAATEGVDGFKDAEVRAPGMRPPAPIKEMKEQKRVDDGAAQQRQQQPHRDVAGRFADQPMLAEVLDRSIRRVPARVFPKPDYRDGFSGTRTDFRDTVHWAPTIQTSDHGTAEVRFYLSDAVTTFRVTTEGLGPDAAGHDEVTFRSVLPVSVATKLPAAVSAGDTLVLPLTVSNSRDVALEVDVSASTRSEIVSLHNRTAGLTLAAGSTDTYWVPAAIGAGNETATIRLRAEGGGMLDAVETQLRIVPAGFPRTWSASGESEDITKLAFQLDDDVVADSLTASVVWHPSSTSTLLTGMEGLIRSPGGCFEQTSSTNWPNVAILSYLQAHDGDPRLIVQSAQALEVGYNKLIGYQVDAGGFETWGTGPGKEALSAFGLLQFADMREVYPVADEILARDTDYLMSVRTGQGGFANTGQSAHGYGSAPAAVLDGFITYALVTTGHTDDLGTEIAHQAAAARSTTDPYVLALATRTLWIADHPEASRAVERLSAMQAQDGSFPGAASSITRSDEANLLVESTALAALALMESGRARPVVDKAVGWLIDNRQGAGTWGATQATALALAALTTHAEVNKVPRSSGELMLKVNGRSMGTVSYSARQNEPLELSGWQDALREGDNDIVLVHEGGAALPFTVEVGWTSIEPMTSPGAELSLKTSLSTDRAAMGETVRLTATIDNQTDRIVPSPIARIGLPAGLEAQTWQLKELQERGEVAFFETRLREVTLYWDGLHRGEKHRVNLDLVATVPGTFTGPASSAYPYYNDDEKAWDRGLVVEVETP